MLEKPLLSRKKLLVNIFLNFLGTGAPFLVALITIPRLIEGMGTPRFGVLTLAWMVVGYFSLFDFGIGRALTKLVAEKIGKKEESSISEIVWTSLVLMAGLGVVGTMAMAAITPWLVDIVFNIPVDLQAESRVAFYLLAISLPIVITSNGLRGLLEAYQNFGLIAAVKLPLGVITFLGPLVVLGFTNSVADMVLVLLIARGISWLVYIFVCLARYPSLRRRINVQKQIVIALISFGGWMTLSNILAPLLLYLGRFFIVTLLSIEALAYFVTPYEVATKLLIIPSVLIGVLFPAFAVMFQSEPQKVGTLYTKSLLSLFLIMAIPVLIIFIYAQEGITLWIDQDFSENSYLVAKILVVGVFINSFGHLAQAVIQAYGRPDVTAKLHVAELFLYIPYLWYLVENFDINGAAIAWTIRVCISTLILMTLTWFCLSGKMSSR